mgnify:CR=1 FL=1
MSKTKVFDRYGRVIAIDYKYTGEEPVWDKCEKWPIEKFMKERSRMLSFYNYYCSSKDLFPDLIKWMNNNSYTKEQINNIKSLGEKAVNFTTMKLARAMNLGMIHTREDALEYAKDKAGISTKEAHNDIEYVKTNINSALSNVVVKVTNDELVSDVKTISPIERLSNKINSTVISELETMIDENGWTEKQTKVDGINLIGIFKANNIPVKGLKEVYDWLERYKMSLQAALDKDNEFDVEGWAFTSRVGIKNRLKAISSMIDQCDKYSSASKTVRKPRAKKVKDASTQVKNLKYKESDTDYGIQSVSPLSIPGCNKVITFNTKYRKLSVYYAESPIEVKGTSLKNFNEHSYSTTLRKPNDILPILCNKTDKQITKALEALTTKKTKANGRINSETVILRTL